MFMQDLANLEGLKSNSVFTFIHSRTRIRTRQPPYLWVRVLHIYLSSKQSPLSTGQSTQATASTLRQRHHNIHHTTASHGGGVVGALIGVPILNNSMLHLLSPRLLVCLP